MAVWIPMSRISFLSPQVLERTLTVSAPEGERLAGFRQGTQDPPESEGLVYSRELAEQIRDMNRDSLHVHRQMKREDVVEMARRENLGAVQRLAPVAVRAAAAPVAAGAAVPDAAAPGGAAREPNQGRTRSMRHSMDLAGFARDLLELTAEHMLEAHWLAEQWVENRQRGESGSPSADERRLHEFQRNVNSVVGCKRWPL
ncbi:MAG: hypothetical protein H7831_05135 [Magnetococcus sp. WYHC-3]